MVLDGFTLVLPMHFALDGDTVVMQTNEGAKYLSAPMTAVRFEVDQVDFEQRVGWSVLVCGYAEDISGSIDERSEHLRRLAANSWAPPPADRCLKIVPQQISGRRLRARATEGSPS